MKVEITDQQFRCLALSLLYNSDVVAATMGISPQTVKNHLYVVYRKLGVKSKSQAAVRLGWLDIPGRYLR
jgi:DNA-binding CsgD family transcriptional regulator